MRRDPFPFDLLEAAFQALGAEPAPLAVDGRDIAIGSRRGRYP